jgi:hypothetical protein
MASGFQNNQDQLTPIYYRVQINMANGGTSNAGYISTATSNASGGIEPYDFTNFATLNTTTNYSRRRARGNIRWNSILNQLQLFDNVQILDVTNLTTVPGDEIAADDVAEKVFFTIGYTQEAYVFHGWQNLIGSGNFSNASSNSFNTTYATTYDQLSLANRAAAMEICIKEAVTRGVTIGGSAGYSRRYKTYDPDAAHHLEEQITVTQPDTPANVWSDVTVNIINTMTQTTF